MQIFITFIEIVKSIKNLPFVFMSKYNTFYQMLNIIFIHPNVIILNTYHKMVEI